MSTSTFKVLYGFRKTTMLYTVHDS